MSHSAFFRTVETALNQTIVARLVLEECELLIGSEYGVVLLPIQGNERSFEPALPQSLSASEWTGCGKTLDEILAVLKTQRSIEIYGGVEIGLLQQLAQQSDLTKHYSHGILYLHQTETIEDLLETIFEKFYQVPLDAKPSREEVRSGLSDRQALILLNQLALTELEFDQLQRTLPKSVFAITSTQRCFPQIETAIEQISSNLDLSVLSEAERAVLELLATVETSLSAEQINAISYLGDLQRLIDLQFVSVEQQRYRLQINYQSSAQWMEKALAYVLPWIRSQPSTIVQEWALLRAVLQWSSDQKRWSEVVEIARSSEGAFAIAKRWGSWAEILRWSLAAAWALEDEAIEAWALHQLGTLAFCQEEVTAGYDRLNDALEIRTELTEQTAIAFSNHNLAQIRALIVPVEERSHLY